jgi:hypothetical protein
MEHKKKQRHIKQEPSTSQGISLWKRLWRWTGCRGKKLWDWQVLLFVPLTIALIESSRYAQAAGRFACSKAHSRA